MLAALSAVDTGRGKPWSPTSWLIRKNRAPSLSGKPRDRTRNVRTEIASTTATPVATAGHCAAPIRQRAWPTSLPVGYDAGAVIVGNATTSTGVFVGFARARPTLLVAIGA